MKHNKKLMQFIRLIGFKRTLTHRKFAKYSVIIGNVELTIKLRKDLVHILSYSIGNKIVKQWMFSNEQSLTHYLTECYMELKLFDSPNINIIYTKFGTLLQPC